jgi:ribosomal protein S18 acetylase RimI-like enzyme
MASEAPPLHRFVRSEPQVNALRAMCGEWQTGDERFWAFDDVLEAVSRPASLAFFAAATPASGWDGVIIADVGPFTADLLYVHVRPPARRHGLGRRLVERLLDELEGRPQIESLFLEVRASNAGAQALYAQLGLAPVGRRRAYYQNGEDALVLRYVFERVPRAETSGDGRA